MSSELVPEDFDLDHARQAPSTTPHNERPRCPECNQLAVRKKTGKPSSNPDGPSHYCNRCGAKFDEPVYGDSDD